MTKKIPQTLWIYAFLILTIIVGFSRIAFAETIDVSQYVDTYKQRYGTSTTTYTWADEDGNYIMVQPATTATSKNVFHTTALQFSRCWSNDKLKELSSDSNININDKPFIYDMGSTKALNNVMSGEPVIIDTTMYSGWTVYGFKDDPYMYYYCDSDPSVNSTDSHFARYSTALGKYLMRFSFYVAVDNKNDYVYEDDVVRGSTTYTVFVITRENLETMINMVDPTWLSSLQSAEEKGAYEWIGVDNVILNGNPTGGFGGTFKSVTGSNVVIYSPIKVAFNTGTSSGGYSGEIATWANNTYLKTHESPYTKFLTSSRMWTKYNNFFQFRKNDPEIVTDAKPVDETETKNPGDIIVDKTTDGANTKTSDSKDDYASPDVRTYNYDTEYNIASGIPASEDFMNGVHTDSWYGHYKLTTVNKKRTIGFRYHAMRHYMQLVGYSYHSDSDGDGENDSDYGPDYEERIAHRYSNTSGDIYRTYYYISNLHFYEIDSQTTYNDAQSSTSYYYNPAHVQYNFSINGITYASGSEWDGSADTFYTGNYPAPLTTEHDNYHIVDNTAQISRATIEFDIGWADSFPASTDTTAKNLADERVNANPNYYIVYNDTLQINGVTYLTKDAGTKGSGLSLDGNSALNKDSGVVDYHINTVDKITSLSGTGQPSGNIVPETNCTIPTERKNGKYFSTITAKYKRFMSKAYGTVDPEYVSLTIDDRTANTTNAILNTYVGNEPIHVFSPVIAPAQIIDSEAETQLASTPTSAPQLMLDGEYTMQFDWKLYFSLQNYDIHDSKEPGWTTYVEGKYVAFPFTVEINGQIYEPNMESTYTGGGDDPGYGYTDYIRFDGDTKSFKFYIPSWSQEGVYGVDGYTGYDAVDRPIKIRCTANNYSEDEEFKETFERNAYDEAGINDMYVARFDVPVQVSGRIYGFQVVASNDTQTFWDNQKLYIDEETPLVVDFVKMSDKTGKVVAEKKIGYYNRIGEDAQRYTLDGDITNYWAYENTIALTQGKSILNTTGYGRLGSTFAFTVKTIANLSAEDSYVKITPTFRYVSSDGSTVLENNQLQLYYDDGGESYIKAGSAEDKNHTQQAALAGYPYDAYFGSSYFDYYYDTIQDTADLTGKSTNYVKYTESDCYCVSEIKMDSNLRLLTGNEEELTFGSNRTTLSTVTNILSNLDMTSEGAYRYNDTILSNVYNEDEYEDFKASMQTWYGMYRIPLSLKVTKKDVDVDEYAKEHGGLTGEEDFWLDDGYLVINFDITTYKDGDNAHLKYYGGNGGFNQWGVEKEGPNGDGVTSDPNVPSGERPGDVTVVPLNDKFTKYDYGILYLN